MAKLDLREGEELIEQAAASHVKKVLIMPQANPGNLFVTNQRVVFRPTQGRPSSQFEYELSDLRSFSVGMASTITLHTKSGEEHKITGMFNKKLISALEKAGLAQEERHPKTGTAWSVPVFCCGDGKSAGCAGRGIFWRKNKNPLDNAGDSCYTI